MFGLYHRGENVAITMVCQIYNYLSKFPSFLKSFIFGAKVLVKAQISSMS
jgi:hypothetical protein